MSDKLDYATITAVFDPQKTDDLRAEAAACIGRRMTFEYAGYGDHDEAYPHERRWVSDEMGYLWTPESDLKDIKVLE